MATAAMATGARLFNAMNVEGETMTAFACGFGMMDELIERMVITLITVLGSALAFVAVVVAVIIKNFKSRGPE